MANEMRLIDANAFIVDIETEIVELWLNGLKGTPQPRDQLYDIINRIDEQPTVDAVPVVHGWWEKYIDDDDDKCCLCTACGWHICYEDCSLEDLGYNYCPNCGAKMDGSADNEID